MSGDQYTKDEQVTVEAIKFLYQSTSVITYVQFSFPLFIAWIFWDNFEHSHIILWCVAVSLLYAFRIYLTKRFQVADNKTYKDYLKWADYFTFSAIISGILWGYAAILFYSPDSVNLQVLLYVLIIGVAAGALTTNVYWLPSFYAYTIPSMGLIALNLLMQADLPSKVLGILLILYMLVFVVVARRTRAFMYDAIRIKFEKIDLVNDLQKQKDLADVASRAKTQFLAAANHDLRQPVASLRLMVAAAKTELETERGRRIFGSMSTTVEGLSELLESLLDLSRLDAGAVRPDIEDINLAPICHSLFENIQPIAEQKNLHLRLVDNSINHIVKTDSILLEQVLRNVLGNAIRYTDEGGVLLGCRKRGDQLLIEIWDTGVGIAESEYQKIFIEFYQSEGEGSNSTKGLGLGLSICNRISRLLDYDMSVHSRLGKGTVFRVKVPLSKKDAVVKEQVKLSIRDHDDSLVGVTVLVIDDEHSVREALQELIIAWGGEAVAVASSAEAVEVIKSRLDNLPDAIISDYRLAHGERGTDVISAVLQASGDVVIPAMILTGDTSPVEINELNQMKYPVLHKPAHPEALHSYLCSIITTKDL